MITIVTTTRERWPKQESQPLRNAMINHWRLLPVLALLVLLTGCSGVVSPPEGDASLSHLSGRIIMDGSSTVYPVAQAMAEEFGYLATNVQIPVGISGTGGGFSKLCDGQTDLANASRPVKTIEQDRCAENNIDFIEVPVAYDGLSVLVNPENDWVDCLTVDQLRRIWEPAAERTVTSWRDVDPAFPDLPLTLYGPGTDSGTFEYFTEVITGEAGYSRGDFTGSEDDNILIQGVAGDRSALGFFGFAYYMENQDRLKLLAVDNGEGCVLPTEETIADGSYQPLSRPIFMYLDAETASGDAAQEFMRFILEQGAPIVTDVGYIPLPEDVTAILVNRVLEGRTGSVFTNREAGAGVQLDDLLFDEERQ